jgi:hypothetical protein
MPLRSENRHRRSSSRVNDSLAVSTSSLRFSTHHQWFPCGPLLASHLTWFFPGLFLLCSRPWLLTTAAEGGLEPAPASRFRGAFPHRSSSYTHWALLGPLRSWRTIAGIAPSSNARPVWNLPLEPVCHAEESTEICGDDVHRLRHRMPGHTWFAPLLCPRQQLDGPTRSRHDRNDARPADRDTCLLPRRLTHARQTASSSPSPS